jgi:hypothetical protein
MNEINNACEKELSEILKDVSLSRTEDEGDKDRGTYFFNEIQNKIPEFSVVDWTDLIDSRCYEFEILLTKGQDILDNDEELLNALGGIRRDMRVFISRIINYYYIYVEKMEFDKETYSWIFTRETLDDKTCIYIKKELKKLMYNLDYKYLRDDIAKCYLPNMRTEFLEVGKVRVFHYLFTEFEEFYEKKVVAKSDLIW